MSKVVENSASEIEEDVMFPYVRSRFEIVPLELKLALMQSPLSRIVGLGAALVQARALQTDRDLRRSKARPTNGVEKTNSPAEAGLATCCF